MSRGAGDFFAEASAAKAWGITTLAEGGAVSWAWTGKVAQSQESRWGFGESGLVVATDWGDLGADAKRQMFPPAGRSKGSRSGSPRPSPVVHTCARGTREWNPFGERRAGRYLPVAARRPRRPPSRIGGSHDDKHHPNRRRSAASGRERGLFCSQFGCCWLCPSSEFLPATVRDGYGSSGTGCWLPHRCPGSSLTHPRFR